MSLERVISVRLSTSEAERIRELAAADGLTVSEYVRRAAVLTTIPVVEQADARCEHLSTAGRFVAVSCGTCGPLLLVSVKES